MNSFAINISGYWYILIFAIIIAIAISYFYYRRTVPELPAGKRYLLFFLRSMALSLLIFVLFEPIYTNIISQTQPPKLVVLLDNSISLKIKDGKYDRKKIYKQVLDKLNLKNAFEDIETVAFDVSFKFLSIPDFDSLSFDGEATNISKAVKYVGNSIQDKNIQAVILITDGAFNAGANPLYIAEQTAKPFYIVGIGDTTEPKDVSVHSVITNSIVSVNSIAPVNVQIAVNGYKDKELNVSLLDNSKPVSNQKIKIHSDNEKPNLTFEYDAKIPGIHKLTIKTQPLKDEITLKNNSQSEFIEVSSDKKKIIILAGAPGPDLSFITKTLKQDKGLEINSFIQKKGAKFYNKQPQKADFANADIIFLIGYPNKFSPDYTLNLLKDALNRGKSLFFIASRDLAYNKLKPIQEYLPFSIISANNKEYKAVAHFIEQVGNLSLLKVNGESVELKRWNQLPPLFHTELFVKTKPQAQTLAKVKVNDVVLNEPMILTGRNQGQRTVAILAYGLYRWKLLGYAEDELHNPQNAEDLFSALIQNSIAWLSSDINKKNVIIKPLHKKFTSNEKIEFAAQVYDASLNPLDNAKLNVKINDGKNTNEIELYPLGNGQYSGYIENLPEGDYFYKGYASLNKQIIGSDKGRFSVGSLLQEYRDFTLNKTLLEEISARTNGKFYYNANVENIVSDIKNNPSFKTRAITLNNEIAIWHLPIILAVVIFLFALEWFLRKRFGLL